MKNKETIEEAISKFFDNKKHPTSLEIAEFGAKWQQENSYSEEDIKLAFIEGHNICRCVTDNTDEAKECFNLWFEQFKKK